MAFALKALGDLWDAQISLVSSQSSGCLNFSHDNWNWAFMVYLGVEEVTELGKQLIVSPQENH